MLLERADFPINFEALLRALERPPLAADPNENTVRVQNETGGAASRS